MLFVHGIGAQDESFADGVWEDLSGRLEDAGARPGRIAWQPGYWADVVQRRQDGLWDDLSLEDLRWDELRRFVVSFLGDATAYRITGTGHDRIYRDIHESIRVGLAEVRHQLGDADKPLIIVAHSLGAHIISNYIWDATRGDPGVQSWSLFERTSTLAGLLTTGCNIPLFTLAYDKIERITFPPDDLGEPLRSHAKWLKLLRRRRRTRLPAEATQPKLRQQRQRGHRNQGREHHRLLEPARAQSLLVG